MTLVSAGGGKRFIINDSVPADGSENADYSGGAVCGERAAGVVYGGAETGAGYPRTFNDGNMSGWAAAAFVPYYDRANRCSIGGLLTAGIVAAGIETAGKSECFAVFLL